MILFPLETLATVARQARIQDSEGGGGSYIQKGGVSYRNFRSGSKLLQGPGQINKQKKIPDSRRGGGGGGSDHPKKNPVSAHARYVQPCIIWMAMQDRSLYM